MVEYLAQQLERSLGAVRIRHWEVRVIHYHQHLLADRRSVLLARSPLQFALEQRLGRFSLSSG